MKRVWGLVLMVFAVSLAAMQGLPYTEIIFASLFIGGCILIAGSKP